MYAVDEHDELHELNLPHMNTGAPLPRLQADGYTLSLWYNLAYDEAVLRRIRIAFTFAHCHYFGAPNDEALDGHPLWDRGLGPYGVFIVKHSSWIRSLERANRVHDRHRPERYDALSHYIFTFHDETFECVAEGFKYRIVTVERKDIGEVIHLGNMYLENQRFVER